MLNSSHSHFTGSESRSLCSSSAYASSVREVMATGKSEHALALVKVAMMHKLYIKNIRPAVLE